MAESARGIAGGAQPLIPSGEKEGRARASAVLKALARMEPHRRKRLLATLPPPAFRAIAEEWWWQAHGGQAEPEGDWRVWMIMAGRGFGKTRVGAEWVSERARTDPEARIALVGGSMADVATVMIEGPSGILSVARTGEMPLWIRSRGLLVFPSGAQAYCYSGEQPEKLRGPEHHFAWADELAKWRRAEAAWNNLQLGLRKGERPRTLVTTTPRTMALLKQIKALPGTKTTGGWTSDNPHLPDVFRDEMEKIYGGTRPGRQELRGELIEDVEGALFPRDLLDKARDLESLERQFLKRVVVGVDPPASVGGTCGIVACGLGADEDLYVLADCSLAGARPEGWARAVVKASEAWQADRIVAEKNQGGDMVESVLRGVDSALPVTLVSASKGKSARAEPVAARFEKKRAKLAGHFPELEDELAGLCVGGDYQGPGRSPDRADAMVWALTELMRPRGEPRILSL